MKTQIAILLVGASLMAGVSGAELAPPKFRAVEIDGNIQIGYGLAIADVDGDKRPDILLVDKHQVVWYQNPKWTKHVMVENLTPQDHVCIAAADLDGDGKAEVAVGAGWNPGDTLNSGSVHYLLPPADRTQLWDPVKLPHEPTVHRMRWVQAPDGARRLVVVPLHGRGNRGGEGTGVKIIAYTKPDNPRDEWKLTGLDDSLHMTHNFDPVQWDQDRAEEMLVAAKEGVFLLDWKSGGGELKKLGGGEPGAGEIRMGRFPGNKRYIATVEPMHGNQTVVYTQGSSQDSSWNRQVIDETLVDGHAVACGDLLRKGYDQLVVGWRAMNRPGVKVGIKLYLPPDREGKAWESHLIDDNTMACEDLVLADLDGDGWLDIVAAGRATKNVKIYFNEGSAR